MLLLPGAPFLSLSLFAIDVLVIHTMESPEKPDTAESVANWFSGSTAPQASAHYCIDGNSIVQCVHDDDVAWHAATLWPGSSRGLEATRVADIVDLRSDTVTRPSRQMRRRANSALGTPE